MNIADFISDSDEGIPVPSPQCRRSGRFVHAPVEWIRRAQLTKGRFAVVCAMAVWYMHCVTKQPSFKLSNIIADSFGINRKQKAAGLKSLHAAGLIDIEQPDGSSPTVVMLL